MGKPLRKPMPTFSTGITSENRIFTRNSSYLKTSRLFQPIPSSSKNSRNTEVNRRSSSHATFPETKQTCLTSSARVAQCKNGIFNEEKTDKTIYNKTATLETGSPPNKCLKKIDNSHVLKNVNKNEELHYLNSVQVSHPEVTKEFSSVHRRWKTGTIVRKPSNNRGKATGFEIQRYDQNVSPSTSLVISNNVSYEEEEEEMNTIRRKLRGCRSQLSPKIPALSLKRGIRISADERLLPVPPSLKIAANGFELPTRRKSARIQEKRRKESPQALEDMHTGPDPKSLVCKKPRKTEQIEIPKFSFVGPLKPVEPSSHLISEDLSDEAFLKRHQKKENEERRAKKNDLREQREQAFRERMMKKQMKNPQPSPSPPPRFTIIEVVGNGRRINKQRIPSSQSNLNH